ncbi:hypothetical protein [Limnobaculum parvum]|uniref:Uncharacterized protein n=1 Tax=Limnobaculum parvum TaxID=2172103 RepID=A0A2Y9TW31_9GAMM|nr:hypothetical protein [Limnobaculum parvum]AWH87781.1 hypothetical protein HYN51_03910 [Limnobaculum parvum]
MGATFFIGYKPPENDNIEGSLHEGLNRSASNALEVLFKEALQERFVGIYDQIMQYEVLDQISFIELSITDFNIAVQAIRNCISSRKEPSELQIFQKNIWETQIEPLIQQDERYQQG